MDTCKIHFTRHKTLLLGSCHHLLRKGLSVFISSTGSKQSWLI